VQRGWRVISVPGGYRLQNVDPAAKYVLRPGGTRYMVDRGFWEALRRETTARIQALILRAARTP
jgi:hypothetical protein